MQNKRLITAWAIFSVPASLICFYATNLLLSDIANMFYMTLTWDIISSIPIFLIAAECVMAAVGMVHAGLCPAGRNRLLRRYAAAAAVMSAAGCASAVYTGTVLYGSFTAPYPFRGATILTLIFHAVLTAAAVCCVCHLPSSAEKAEKPKNTERPKKPEKEEKQEKPKKTGKRIGGSVRWGLAAILVYYAFDRFGAVLWMPVYMQLSTLYKTFPFYLSLLLPILLLLHHGRYRLGLCRKGGRAAVLYAVLYLAADLGLGAAVIVRGMVDTQFLSAISPALGIERLLNMPVVTIVHFILVTVLILVSVVRRLRILPVQPDGDGNINRVLLSVPASGTKKTGDENDHDGL